MLVPCFPYDVNVANHRNNNYLLDGFYTNLYLK